MATSFPASLADEAFALTSACLWRNVRIPRTIRRRIAATIAGELCGQLYAGGVRHFHFYTLNLAELAYAICHLLGVRA